MRSYTKKYLDELKLDETSFCGCEVCGCRATEIHHITARSKYKEGLNKIENIMAICRSCHQNLGDKKSKMIFLLETHWQFLIDNGVKFDENYFIEKIIKYEN